MVRVLSIVPFAVLSVAALARAATLDVANPPELAAALAAARPGDTVVLKDGTYLVSRKIKVAVSGTAVAPITVRAAHPRAPVVKSDTLIVFEVTGSYIHFQDLELHGVCQSDSDCEHAFHVVAPATGFRLSSSRLSDFNAHVKVNGNAARQLAGEGLIEDSEFWDTHPRHTDNPVAPINIDDAGPWVVRDNFIHDFQKSGSGEPPYGAFVKGGSSAPILEGNLVECSRNGPSVAQAVGLSFGAGGMAPALCPPHWDAAIICDPEVLDGKIRNNVVRQCGGAGIYINRGRNTQVLYNTLIETAGIEFRHAGATGIARGNLLTSAIYAVDGARLRSERNEENVPSAGTLIPRAAAANAKPGLSEPEVTRDYCGRKRQQGISIGAIEASFGPCPLMKWHWQNQTK